MTINSITTDHWTKSIDKSIDCLFGLKSIADTESILLAKSIGDTDTPKVSPIQVSRYLYRDINNPADTHYRMIALRCDNVGRAMSKLDMVENVG